jgi:hypothetical protein
MQVLLALLARRWVFAVGVMLALGGVGVAVDNSVGSGVALIVLGLALAAPLIAAMVLEARDRGASGTYAVSPVRSDPAVQSRFRNYGLTVLALGVLTVGVSVWVALPGTVGDAGDDPVATTLAKLVCPGTITITVGISLIFSGAQILAGKLIGAGKAWVALRGLWVLAVLALAWVLVGRPSHWPAVAVLCAIFFGIGFAVDLPLKRLIADVRALEEKSPARHAS